MADLLSVLDILSDNSKKVDVSWETIYLPIVRQLARWSLKQASIKFVLGDNYYELNKDNDTFLNLMLDYKKCRKDLIETLNKSRKMNFEVIASKVRQGSKMKKVIEHWQNQVSEFKKNN